MSTEINLRVIKNIPFLSQNFSEPFLVYLSKHFKEKRFGPEEVIYTKGKPANSFYILCTGEVQKYVILSNHNLKLLDSIKHDSAIFGHLDFFMDKYYECNSKSIQVSYVLEINRKSILNAFKDFPHDYVHYPNHP
jgi:CRP-like cAMP-binding protein